MLRGRMRRCTSVATAIGLAAALVALAPATPAAAAAPAVATATAHFYPGAKYINPDVVTVDGLVGGVMIMDDDRQLPYVWTEAGGYRVLDPRTGDTRAQVTAIGPDGTAYGTSYHPSPDPDLPELATLVRWLPSTVAAEDLGRPAADVNHYMSIARVNAAGTALVSAERAISQTPLTTTGRAFTLDLASGTFRDLGDLGGAVVPFDMNEAGAVTGIATTSLEFGDWTAFVWTPSSPMVSIGSLVTDDATYPAGIDVDGNIAGTSVQNGSTTTAFRWTAGGGITAIGGTGSLTAAMRRNGTFLTNDIVRVPHPRYGTVATTRPFIHRPDGSVFQLPDDPARSVSAPIPGISLNDHDEVLVGDQYVADSVWFWSAAAGYVPLPRSDASMVRQYAWFVANDGLIIGQEMTAGYASNHLITWRVSTVPPNPDANGDGVDDAIAGATSGSFVDAITGQPTTSGNIVSVPTGLTVRVSDALDPDGVRVVVGGSAGPTDRVTISACGFTVRLAAGSDVVLTCGSIEAKVTTGPAEIDLGDGTKVVVSSGAVVKVATGTDGGFTVQNLTPNSGTGTVTIVSDGASSTLPAGTTSPLQKWHFAGFADPVKNLPTVNTARRGQTVPLKWHLTDSSGRAVTTLRTVTLRYVVKNCTTGAELSSTVQSAAGASGLQNLGNGDYQVNWTTPTASGCGEIRVDIGQGVPHVAAFQLR